MKDQYDKKRRFYLIQRMYESEPGKYDKMSGGRVDHNPFGYGRLGAYELDYMGSAEFEWGAIPDSTKRFGEAGNSLMMAEHMLSGHSILFMYIEADGDPWEDFLKWFNGDRRTKEEPYGFIRKVENKEERFEDKTTIWWSLDDDVMWCFAPKEGEKSHIQKLLDTMPTAKNSLRDYSHRK